MADLLSSAYSNMYDNAGQPIATAKLGHNYLKHVINQADVGRELIIKVSKTNMTDAELTTIIRAITLAGGAAGVLPAGENDAFTVAAVATADGSPFVSGTTDVVFLKAQGTGTYEGDSSDAHGVTGATTEVVAVFTPAK